MLEVVVLLVFFAVLGSFISGAFGVLDIGFNLFLWGIKGLGLLFGCLLSIGFGFWVAWHLVGILI